MITRLPATEARDNFFELLDRVKYTKEHVVVEKRGKERAAIVPMEAFRVLKALYADADAEDIERAMNSVKMEMAGR